MDAALEQASLALAAGEVPIGAVVVIDGEIVARDPKNDLALIRVSGRPAGARPLWQNPRPPAAHVGDELLLLGSPYGLEGTVTTGVVSRVTKTVIQTGGMTTPATK